MAASTNIEMVQVSAIMPASYNPNILSANQFKQLVAEIKRTGRCQKPIVARANNDGTFTAIDGSHNLRAAIEAGLLDVPIEIIEVDDYEARRQTYVRNKSGTWHKVRLGRMWREMMASGSGRSGREVAKDLGVTQGTVVNIVRYADADELRSLRDNTLTEDDIARMSVRRVREYVAKFAAAEADNVPRSFPSRPIGADEPPDLRALKRAWDKASDASRASFMAWPNLAETIGGRGLLGASDQRDSAAGIASPESVSNCYSVSTALVPGTISTLDADARGPTIPAQITPRRRRARLRYGLTGEELTALCRSANTTVTAFAKELGFTPSNLSRHVNNKSAAPPKDALRLAIVNLKKLAKRQGSLSK